MRDLKQRPLFGQAVFLAGDLALVPVPLS